MLRLLNLNVVDSSRDAEFPEFTICPSYQSYKEYVLEHYNLKDKDVEHFKFPENVNSAEFFKNATYSANELIKLISIRVSDNLPNSDETTFDINFDALTLDDISNWVVTKNWTSSGRCYGFKIPDWIRNLKVSILSNTYACITLHQLCVLRLRRSPL